MKFNINETNKYIIGADTDSLFIGLEPILKHKFPDLDLNDKTTVIPIVRSLQKEFEIKTNTFQNKAAKNLFNCSNHFYDFKPEFIVQTVYWSNKRRYAQLLCDREGKPIEKFVIMGLDITKSNFGPYFSKFGEQLIKDILLGKPKAELDKEVMEFKKSINTIEWKKLLKPSGLKKLDEYIESPPKAGEIFSKLRLKCPVNSRAGIVTNDLLRFYNLNKEYPEFIIGDKINIAKLKDNPYKIDVIGLNGYRDSHIILDIVEKFIDRDGLFESIMYNKLQTIYNDLGWELNLNPYMNNLNFIEID
jgi:hypothetical protein